MVVNFHSTTYYTTDYLVQHQQQLVMGEVADWDLDLDWDRDRDWDWDWDLDLDLDWDWDLDWD